MRGFRLDRSMKWLVALSSLMALAACSDDDSNSSGGDESSGSGGEAGKSAKADDAKAGSGGSGGDSKAGSGGDSKAGSGGDSKAGSGGDSKAGSAGEGGKQSGDAGASGSAGGAGRAAGGMAGEGGTAASGGEAGEGDMAGGGGAAAGSGPSQPLVFAPVPVPVTDAEKRDVLASEWVEVDGVRHNTGYHVVQRSGDSYDDGDNVFGRLVDQNMDPILGEDGEAEVSQSADFSSLLPVGDRLFSVTHFESRPGAMYLSELEQDSDTGMLSAVSTQPLDFSDSGGLWVPCAGSVTPWGSHLGSEEYPPDARGYEEATTIEDLSDYDWPMYRYYGLDVYTADDATGIPTLAVDDIRASFNPYWVGFPVEVVVEEDGSYATGKHYAMGRVAVELAYVMPDEQTAYITDDGSNVLFLMFVADVAGELSSGDLYAAQWNQTSSDGVAFGEADLTWIDLGHATDDQVSELFDSSIVFSDIFTSADPDEDGECPTDFLPSIGEKRFECLQVNPGMELAASRLETRRYASMMGATAEFRKEEGVTFDPETGTLFVAMSQVGTGMLDGGSADTGGPNHIRLQENDCGAVYTLDVAPDDTIGSDYVAQNMHALVWGTPRVYPSISPYVENSCDVDGIANPDNVTFIPGYDTLIIGEDTGAHQNDMVWAYTMSTGELTRIQTTPYGSETTSPYFYPNINGWAYLKSVIQHPFGESDEDQLEEPSEANSYDGYIGPFPAMD